MPTPIDLEAVNNSIKGKLPELLGIKISELGSGNVTANMSVETKHHQPMGVLHGGVSVALAETVASIGGWYLVADAGKMVVGQEINANHLRQVKSGILTARGVIVHQGKTSQVWEINIFDQEDRLICISRCTLAVITPR